MSTSVITGSPKRSAMSMSRIALRYPSGRAMPKLRSIRRLGVVALLMADHHDRLVVEPREAAHHGMVVREVAVAGQRGEFPEQLLDVVAAMRAVRVPRHLAFLPGRQPLVEVAEHVARLLVESGGLLLARPSSRSPAPARAAPRPCLRSRTATSRSRGSSSSRAAPRFASHVYEAAGEPDATGSIYAAGGIASKRRTEVCPP